VLAIDPGDVHVGWASYVRTDTEEKLYDAGEISNSEARKWVQGKLKRLDRRWVRCNETELIIEKFQLYGGDTLGSQIGKTMDTSELIGALKWIAAESGVNVVEQGASIQKPIEAQLRGRGIELLNKGRHAKSAQLHLWYRLLSTNQLSAAKEGK
jgi:hypothetical protein